jgi:hypothetical protein
MHEFLLLNSRNSLKYQKISNINFRTYPRLININKFLENFYKKYHYDISCISIDYFTVQSKRFYSILAYKPNKNAVTIR